MPEYQLRPPRVIADRFMQDEPWPPGVLPWTAAGEQYVLTGRGPLFVLHGQWIIHHSGKADPVVMNHSEFTRQYEPSPQYKAS